MADSRRGDKGLLDKSLDLLKDFSDRVQREANRSWKISGLKAELQRILGLDREWAVALVGFGNLGSALFHYKGFARQGFRIAAIFDEDPRKVAREIDSTPIFPSRDLGREVRARGIQVAIVAVPAESAQAVADQLVAAGIKAILNFAPARIRVPKDVRFKNVPGPVPVFELLGRRAGANGDVPVDPVCHMRVRPESAADRLVFGDRVYHFCSLDCVRAFASRPEDYVRS